jgi:hypothetical protein
VALGPRTGRLAFLLTRGGSPRSLRTTQRGLIIPRVATAAVGTRDPEMTWRSRFVTDAEFDRSGSKNVDIVPSGDIAIVANNGAAGAADGNVDTLSVIDLQQNPPRVIDHVAVGDAPEGFAISPKGDLALAILVAGNSDKKAWFSRKTGIAVALKIEGKKVTKVGEIEVGGLAEGVAFSPDGAYAYIGNFLDSDISILKINGTQVTDTAKKVKLPGHPASLRSAPK